MPETLSTELQKHADALVPLMLEYGMSLIGAVLVLILGLWVANLARNWVARVLSRAPQVDEMLKGFLGSLVKYAIIGVTLIAVLGQFGVETTSLIAVFGAAGLAIGLALQGTLSNIAAGVMLLIFRPFRAGDVVEVGGLIGTVKQLSLFTTELATADNVQIIVPNGDIWGTAVKNFSFYATRRLDLIFGISYDDDIDLAMRTIRNCLDADPRCQKDPEPLIAVGALGDSSVNITVRVWCQNADYWPLSFDLRREVKIAFDRVGITIPYPTRTVRNAAD